MQGRRVGDACDRRQGPAREDARTPHAARLAGLALAKWGIESSRLVPLSLGFKEVFAVETRLGERFVLRMYGVPPGDGDGGDPRYRVGAGLRRPETILAQLEWLAALRNRTGIAVPEPVASPDGSFLVRVSGAEASSLPRRSLSRLAPGRRGKPPIRNCALLRWLPGTKKAKLAPEDLSRVGAYVAGLHGHAMAEAGPEGAALPRWDWGWPFGESAPVWDRGERFYEAGEMEVFRTAARRVREELDRLGKGRGTFGVIHRDLKFGNLIFDGASVGALDFDLLGHGYYLFDLHMLRFSLEFRTKDPQPLWKAFVEAYDREAPLPDNHARYFATFAAMRRVASVNRQLDLLGSDDADRRPPRYLKDAVAWLENSYIARGR